MENDIDRRLHERTLKRRRGTDQAGYRAREGMPSYTIHGLIL